MHTDKCPNGKTLRMRFQKSDRLRTLKLPKNNKLRCLTIGIEEALATAQPKAVRLACIEFLAAAAQFYKVARPQIRILGSRPRRVWEVGEIGVATTELFGDYERGKNVIRVWMRTA